MDTKENNSIADEIKQLRAQVEQSDKTIRDLVSLFAGLIDFRTGGMPGLTQQIAEQSKSLAQQAELDSKAVNDVETAALLQNLHTMVEPQADLVEFPIKESKPECEHPKAQQNYSSDLLEHVAGFDHVVKILKYFEAGGALDSFNMSDVDSESQFAAEILKVVSKHGTIPYEGQPTNKQHVGEATQDVGEMLGQKLVTLFKEEVLPRLITKGQNTIWVELPDLKPGMVLARDTYNIAGVRLINSGTELTKTRINQLKRSVGVKFNSKGVLIRCSEGTPEKAQPSQEPTQISPLPPKSTEDVSSANEKLAESHMVEKQRLIIAVDDDPFQLGLLKQVLNAEGFTVDVYLNPEIALERISESTGISAVITDYDMPEMLGDEFASRVSDLRSEIPIIAITAVAQEEVVLRLAKSSRMVKILPKPWDKEVLLDALKKLR